VLAINSEVGQSIDKFPTAKAFASWLRLSPNNRISGGKVLSSRVRKGSNRVSSALRQAAESIGKQKDAPLYPFFQRIMYRKGRCAAIIATARKLAVIIRVLACTVSKHTCAQYKYGQCLLKKLNSYRMILPKLKIKYAKNKSKKSINY